MWTVNIYMPFYHLIHSLYTILLCICRVLAFLNSKFTQFCHEFSPVTRKNKHLHKQLCRISKKPIHLTVLLGPETSAPKDLAHIVIWCIATQISFISFYDYKGNLKQREEELQYAISQRKSKEDHVIWHSDPGASYKNGYIGRRIHVKIITEDDGKKSIVNFTRNLALSKTKDISVETINESLRKQFEFPDPDMALVCGKTLSLNDYPPWQIRLTEFFRIESIKDITFSEFLEQLVQFSKCEQRLGK